MQYVLDRTDPPVMWEGADGVLPGRVIMLADGSTVRINTGPNPWARTDQERPLQMWTVGSFHLDDGPLTPAASAFLGDLLAALEEDPGPSGPTSHWLAQRATLDPSTHRITEPGVARPTVEGARTLVWDAAQGWVDARQAGGLARAVDDVLVPAHVFANGPAAAEVMGGAGRVLDLIDRTEQAEQLTAEPGTPEHDAEITNRAEVRAQLRGTAGTWVANSVDQTVAEFVGGRAQVVAESNGRLLVRLDEDRLAVAVIAVAENDALGGSRPGLQQEGTTTDIGQLRNELAASPENEPWTTALTEQLQQGLVRHLRVQGVLADGEFVGMRVTEFEVTQPAHDQPGAPRAGVEPHRHIDPGLAVREAMDRAVAGWTPSSVTDAIDNALRWLPFVNPLHASFPITNRMPWSNNCADCSRAVADLVQGLDARAAFGDNGARVFDSHAEWGTQPGELHEVWRWAGAAGRWHTWHDDHTSFTASANARIGDALATRPVGTVAIVLVGWADTEGGWAGGHWFNAVVTDDGVEWVDGQTAQHQAWPPPYRRPYSGYSVITRAQGSDTWVDLFARPARAAAPGRTAGEPPTAPAGPGAGRSKRGSFVPRPIDPDRLAEHAGIEGPGYSARGSISFSFPPEQVSLTAGRDAQHHASTRARALAEKLRGAFIDLAWAALGDVPPSRSILDAFAESMPRAAGAVVTARGEAFTHTSLGGDGPGRVHPVVAMAFEMAAIDLGQAKEDWHGLCVETALISDVLHAAEARGDAPGTLPGPNAERVAWAEAFDWANRVLDGAVLSVVGIGLPASRKELLEPKPIPSKEPCASCRWVLGKERENDPADFRPVRDGFPVLRLTFDAIHPMDLRPGSGSAPQPAVWPERPPVVVVDEHLAGPSGSGTRSPGASVVDMTAPDSADVAFAARISNPSDWPEEDEQEPADAGLAPGPSMFESSGAIVVESPGGERRTITVGWLDPGPAAAPVLVLEEMPGQEFWWSVPEAVAQAVERARQVLDPDPGRWVRAVVVGRAPSPGPSSRMTQYFLDLGAGGTTPLPRAPRELPFPEAERALAYLGLR